MISEKDFSASLTEHKESVVGLILRKHNINYHDAQDIFQRAALNMYKKLRDYHGGNFFHWLAAFVDREAMNYVKCSCRRKNIDNNYYVEYGETKPQEDKWSLMLQDKLKDVLASLSSEEKELIHAVYYEEISVTELARTHKKPRQTYFNKLSMLRKKLAEELGK